jgi:hypothetical protein
MEQLAATRTKREERATEKVAKTHPLFTDLIRAQRRAEEGLVTMTDHDETTETPLRLRGFRLFQTCGDSGAIFPLDSRSSRREVSS